MGIFTFLDVSRCCPARLQPLTLVTLAEGLGILTKRPRRHLHSSFLLAAGIVTPSCSSPESWNSQGSRVPQGIARQVWPQGCMPETIQPRSVPALSLMTFFIMLGCGLPDPQMRFVLHLRIVSVFATLILIVSGLEP